MMNHRFAHWGKVLGLSCIVLLLTSYAVSAALPADQPAESAQQQATAAATVRPTSTSALLSITVTPIAPGGAAQAPAALGPGVPPAFDITLPTGWKQGFFTAPIREPLAASAMNLAVFKGPLPKGGTGTIFVLWGFPSLAPPPTRTLPGPTPTLLPNVTPIDDSLKALWSDGLRLLQGTVIGITCNVGRYEQRFFQVGGQTGIGAYYNVSNCPGEPDTVGWFIGMHQFGVSYLFYVSVDPIEAYNEGRGDMQKILDTAVFRAPTRPPTGTPGTPGTGTPTRAPSLPATNTSQKPAGTP